LHGAAPNHDPLQKDEESRRWGEFAKLFIKKETPIAALRQDHCPTRHVKMILDIAVTQYPVTTPV
jgi:hypothetical protein